jgi:hypothetical protein
MRKYNTKQHFTQIGSLFLSTAIPIILQNIINIWTI